MGDSTCITYVYVWASELATLRKRFHFCCYTKLFVELLIAVLTEEGFDIIACNQSFTLMWFPFLQSAGGYSPAAPIAKATVLHSQKNMSFPSCTALYSFYGDERYSRKRTSGLVGGVVDPNCGGFTVNLPCID